MVEALVLGFAAVFLVSAAVFVVSLRKLAAAAQRREAGAAPGQAPDPDSRLVARQVLDEQGNPAGETLRVEGQQVVLKRGGEFLVVPRAALREDGEKLRAEGVDWEQARRDGEAWRSRQEDAMAYDETGLPVAEGKP